MDKVKHLLMTVVFSFVFLGGATISTFAQEREVEFIPRIGASIATAYEGEIYGGYNIGGMVSFPIKDRFHLTVVPTFNMLKVDGNNYSVFLLPVYASYCVPVQNVDLHFNVGPYGQLGDGYDFGLSAEIGASYKRWYGGIYAYQNLLIDEMEAFFGVSVGYKLVFH